MRAIYVGTKDSFSKHLVSIEDYANGDINLTEEPECLCAFDDFTTNFEYLGEWDSEKHLNGKTGTEIVQKIEFIAAKFRDQGITTRTWTKEDAESYTNPHWMFGHRDGYHGYLIYPECLLPEDENKAILLFHLSGILDVAREYLNNTFHIE